MDKPKIPYSLRDKIRLTGIIKDRALLGPKCLDILVTSECNIGCLFCTLHSPFSPRKIKPRHVNWPLLKKTVKEACSVNTDAITLSGDGEPWLHPKIKEIIAYIKNNGFYLTINTNLNFSRPDILRAFASADRLRINAASLSQDSYCRIHNTTSGTFNNLTRNLKKLGAMAAARKNPEIILVYIASKLNHKHLPETVLSMKKYRINNIEVELMEERKFTRHLSLNSREISVLSRTIGAMRHNKIKIYSNFKTKKVEKNPCAECYAPYLNGRIETDGTVAFCCKNQNLSLGNINDDSFSNLWFSAKAQRVRFLSTNHFDTNKRLWTPCKHCDTLAIEKNRTIFALKKSKKYEHREIKITGDQ